MMEMRIRFFDDAESFVDADAHSILNEAVDVVDSVQADIADCCSLASAVFFNGNAREGSSCNWWVGGLSPSGHLVGAVTAFDSK